MSLRKLLIEIQKRTTRSCLYPISYTVTNNFTTISSAVVSSGRELSETTITGMVSRSTCYWTSDPDVESYDLVIQEYSVFTNAVCPDRYISTGGEHARIETEMFE